MPAKTPDKNIIVLLNDVLTGELTAVNQYFGHARMQANWGYRRLAEHARNESMDEMRHADELIERILYLEGMPNVQRLGKINIGESVTERRWIVGEAGATAASCRAARLGRAASRGTGAGVGISATSSEIAPACGASRSSGMSPNDASCCWIFSR